MSDTSAFLVDGEGVNALHAGLLVGRWEFGDLVIYLFFNTWPKRTFQFLSRELLVSLNAQVLKLEGVSFDFDERVGRVVDTIGQQTLSCGSCWRPLQRT